MIFLIITYLSLIVKSLAVSNIIYSSHSTTINFGIFWYWGVIHQIINSFEFFCYWEVQRRNIKMVFALSQNEILSVSDLDFHNTLLHYIPLTPAFVIYCHTSPQRGSIKGGFENRKTRGLPRPVTTTRRWDFHIKPPQLLPDRFAISCSLEKRKYGLDFSLSKACR